jgi:3-isopropylmalate/(R)-2-methylmalate dehydratase small subunit
MMIAPRTPAEKGGASTQGGAETVRADDLFAHLRFGGDGKPDADFVLNRAPFREAKFLIAGRNFGCGSAREQAATAIKGLGIKAVVASSFARTFYRNAINDGLPIMECPALSQAVQEGDSIRIDLAAGLIEHAGVHYPFPRLPDSVRRILELGGLAAYLKSQLAGPELAEPKLAKPKGATL